MIRRLFLHGWWMVLGVLLCAVGCSSGGFVAPRIFATSEYERYVSSLEGVDLHQSIMGQSWLAAGRDALSQPAVMALPWREELFFSPESPAAVAWQLSLRRGQKLRAVMFLPVMTGGGGGRFFLDLFALQGEDQAPRRVAEVDEQGMLVHDIDEDGTFLLRLQPELLAGGRLTLEVMGGGQLVFPVEGQDERAIGSRFGDPRDGGSRSHRGVDIFAPRGTLATAAVDGFVTRVGENRLGGQVVWMRGEGKSFYYAHLDEQLVSTGSRVTAGEPVGRVGNTGNARSTPPHLHFGLFVGGAAVDPAPYLVSPGTPPEVTADLALLGAGARVKSSRARLRAGPSTSHPIRDELPQHTALRLEAAGAGWYRVQLGDGRRGYIAGSLVEAADRPLRKLTADGDAFLRHRPHIMAPEIQRITAGETLVLLAELDDFMLVRSGDGATGWLRRALSSP